MQDINLTSTIPDILQQSSAWYILSPPVTWHQYKITN